jgi:spore coat protein H
MLNDHALMKARLEYGVFNDRGVPAPRYAHCRLYVNGDYKGLYGAEERMSREFVRKRFGAPVNQLYEWIGMDDLRWSGPDPAQYVPTMWLPKIEELPWDAAPVRDFVNALNNDLPSLPGHFDVESFLNYIAVETVLGEGDLYVAGFTGERTANIYLYRSPASGKYMILPFDADQGFWRPEHGITQWFENRILTRNVVLWAPDNLSRYRQILRELIDGPYATDRMKARVDSIYRQIEQAAFEDPYKPRDNATFQARVQEIKTYIEGRNAAFRAQLQ